MDIKRDETAKYGDEFNFFSFERPWGGQACICENIKSTVKVISINQNEMLSLQSHKNRDQFYYIIDDLVIQYTDKNSMVQTVEAKSGDTFFFKRGTLHRAINPGPKEIARFFEVAFGENSETDIIRHVDKYSRGNG